MKLSFFDWIREGVKQSVLLGVSDAAEHIGNPDEAEELSQSLIATFQQTRMISNAKVPKSSRNGRRKALGRSLTTIVEEEKVA